MHGVGREGISPLLLAVGKVPNASMSFQRGVLGVGHTPCACGREITVCMNPSVALALGKSSVVFSQAQRFMEE